MYNTHLALVFAPRLQKHCTSLPPVRRGVTFCLLCWWIGCVGSCWGCSTSCAARTCCFSRCACLCKTQNGQGTFMVRQTTKYLTRCVLVIKIHGSDVPWDPSTRFTSPKCNLALASWRRVHSRGWAIGYWVAIVHASRARIRVGWYVLLLGVKHGFCIISCPK